mmetsp:Transcript_144839/g.204972  ORF Transcript_144839/g.204972 Transcript_144839/m.204972 type:complete len:283 (+) Transcript_144839:470-1318(+)
MNLVHALTVGTVRTSSSACCPRCRLVQRPIRVPNNRIVWLRECRGNIVLASVRFSLLVNTWQIIVRWWVLVVTWDVFLEPESELHVVAKKGRSWILIRIKHDAIVVTTTQTTSVLAGVASWVLLLQEITSGRCYATFRESRTIGKVLRANLAATPNIANTCGYPSLVGQCDNSGCTSLMLCKLLRCAYSRDYGDCALLHHVESVVLLSFSSKWTSDNNSPRAIKHSIGYESNCSFKGVASAVFSFRAARAQMLLHDTRFVHDKGIRRVCHHLCVKTNAEPNR